MRAVSILFEVEPNPKKKTEYWNSSFQEWLKDVVYASLITKMNSNVALFVTFALSAFWHGLYLIYYLSIFCDMQFLQCGLYLFTSANGVINGLLSFPKALLTHGLLRYWPGSLLSACLRQ